MILHMSKCSFCDKTEDATMRGDKWEHPENWVMYKKLWFCTPQCLFVFTGAGQTYDERLRR